MSENFVLDNSVVMSWCFKDEINHYADAVLERLEFSEAIVPSIWPLEVGNVLLVAERKKCLNEADSIRFITLLSELPITVEQESPDRMIKEVFALAREHKLSTYDASYLDLAMRKGIPIATLDNNLMSATKNSHVELLKID
ncbi:MAG: type II toxin-antitoxin system VapC family toxin [Desulfobacteraceae bacterium]|nr:type II toxin-antitoxin system VapC family toxin [Desulfobacteraceae bacterium]MBC2758175.1 type II toxin-antitoxin system VapC family toxin [Desulfobacteraceae bacterium]